MYKNISITVLLSLLLNLLCLPLGTEYDYVGFMHTLFAKQARLGLCYAGKITAEEPIHFLFQDTFSDHNVSWTYGNGGVRNADINLRARRKWQKLSLRAEALQDGKISVILSGPDNRDDYGNLHYILTDWRNVKLNGKTILSKQEAFSCKKPFTKQVAVKKGDVLHIEAEFRRHHFSIHDFTWLRSGKIWYVITGNILVLFLIYRLLSHIQGGGIRRINAFLLAIFFPLLFIPMIDISNAVKCTREQRVLATKPRLEDVFKEKADYGRRYENWFNDHFCGRSLLIKLHDFICYNINRIIRTKRALYLKEDGLFIELPEYGTVFGLPHAQLISRNIIQLNEFCKKNKIKLYILEIPKKEIFYKDIVKEKYGFDDKMLTKVSQMREVVRESARTHHIPYIYPYKALQEEAKQDLVFFKKSHHVTETGAFVAYRELMKAILRDFSDMPVVSLSDCRRLQNKLIRDNGHWTFGHGDLLFFFGFKDDPDHSFLYNYYNHKNSNELMMKVDRHVKNFSYPLGKHKVMITGTSHNQLICRFLPFSASETRFIQLNANPVPSVEQWKFLKLFKQDILAFKPEILILSISTDNLPRLRDLCSTK